MTELAPHEQAIAKQAFRAGQPLPEKIANAPELQPGLQLYLQAFFDLDSDRPSAFMGIARIPWTSIANYSKAFELDEEQTEDLFYFIRHMDDSYIAKVAKKSSNGKKPVRPSK